MNARTESLKTWWLSMSGTSRFTLTVSWISVPLHLVMPTEWIPAWLAVYLPAFVLFVWVEVLVPWRNAARAEKATPIKKFIFDGHA